MFEELSDDEILSEMPVQKKKTKVLNTKGLHSELHLLASEVSTFCGEPKKFARYLGVLKRKGLQWGYKTFSELKQSKTVKNPAAIFFYKSKL